VSNEPALHPLRPKCQRTFLPFFAVPIGMVLILAYLPCLADSLESLVIVLHAPPLLPSQPNPDFALDVAGVCQPATLPADKAALDDDAPVIGVLASDRARAYLVGAFENGPASHLVNDVLGGVPISVTRCDRTGCTRVFTSSTAGQPLKLSLGGVRSSRMILKFDGHLYLQETSERLDQEGPSFPYREYPATRTVWRDWRQAHPDTDVYVGAVATPVPVKTSKLQ
jgi:hypothetical protein